MDRLAAAVKALALAHKDTVMIGRSHGIHAEPTTFGLKLAVWYDEILRNKKRIEAAIKTVATGKISGAVGTFANVPPDVEAYVCEKLGLSRAPASTQIVQRDRHAEFFTSLAILASTLEKMAVEIRHLQRTEVLEVQEYFAKGQKGSSAMPHKRNPVGSENISGLARVIRANSLAAMENVCLWHERDISHSSVERVIGPDSTILADYIVNRMAGLIEKLVVYPKQMKSNLEKTKGLIFSQEVMLTLTRKGASREDAYRLVQKNAMRVWDEGANFQDLLLNDPEVMALCSREEILGAFDLDRHTLWVDEVFRRVFTD